MNLAHLSNQELNQQTKFKAEAERLATIELLWHLREVERRMLYAQMSYRDLKEYCVKELKMSEGSAWRRINAMRLLKEIPEVEIKIQSGDLNLTQVTMARTYFREVKATVQEKKEILSAIENQSARATERILVESKPESFAPLAISEKERFLRGQKLEVTFILDEETQKNLEEIEVLLNRKYSKLELFKMMTQRTLHQLKKKQSVVKEQMKSETRNDFTDRKLSTGDQSAHSLERKAQPSVKAQSKKSRYISAKIRKAVAQRDQNRCQFVDPVSRRQCECRVHLEFDHIKAFAQGGENSYENLQLLCSTHNKLRALQTYGNNKMRIYQSSLR